MHIADLVVISDQGWPADQDGVMIQSFSISPHHQPGEFMLQIASEEKTRFMIGDNGTMYFYYDKELKE